MIIGLAIFLGFSGLLALFIISYEKPSKNRKLTGRGGDFSE
jgi:hypothetical protein